LDGAQQVPGRREQGEDDDGDECLVPEQERKAETIVGLFVESRSSSLALQLTHSCHRRAGPAARPVAGGFALL